MDNKDLFRALLGALLVFLIWTFVANRIWPPQRPTVPPLAPVTTRPADDGFGVSAEPAAQERAAVTTAPTSGLRAVGAAEAKTVVLGDTTGFTKSPFRMSIELCNLGASIETVLLSDHAQTAKNEERYRLLSPVMGESTTWRSLAVDQINIDNAHQVVLGDVPWDVEVLERNDAQEAVFTVRIMQGDVPAFKLVRTFSLRPEPVEMRRHDLVESLSIENLTDEEHRVIVRERGPVGLTSEGRFMPDRKVYAARRSQTIVELATRTFTDIGKQHYKLYARDADSAAPLVWWGAGNLYFTCTICPLDSEGRSEPGYVTIVEGVDLEAGANVESDVTARMTTEQVSLPPKSVRTFPATLYLGPKDRKAFTSSDNPDYMARNYMAQIKEGYGSCTFNFLTDLMIRLLDWLETVFRNFGVAIIVLVVIVRVILHPVTKKTQVNMVKMQQNMGKLQPKMEELKKKHAGDNARLQQEMMKLYREEGVNPFGQILSCLPMLLQMPIWIALYTSLRNNVAMRGRGFLWWIDDLTTPDYVVAFDAPVRVPLFGWELDGFHLLPILVGVMMFAQQKLMPKPKKQPGAVESPQAQQAEQMQKIMPYMSLVMIILFYKFPSGLNLYIMTSSLIGTVEQAYIRRHISERDLQAKHAPAVQRLPKQRTGPSFFARLQKQAVEAQKFRSQRKQRKRRN